ncbi:MAG: hypothetical protein P1U56_06565, partial [Saprospiraceae bacterium]|nr:hypothetical protein [Saprospiraceae bacterium]
MKITLQNFVSILSALFVVCQMGKSQCTVDAGTISTLDPTTICVDGIPDPINVTVSGATGTESAWIITDTGNTILASPPSGPFDLNGAGPGTCLIWYISHDGTLAGNVTGNNISDLTGCFDLSNEITVERNEPLGGIISTTDETTICVDGIGDPIDVSLAGNSGGNSAWVITDESLNILGLPPGPPFDLDGAGPGVCLIWHLSFEDGLTGAEVGMNAADLDGCYELSNSIAVTRNEPIGGMISTTDETTICVDGIGDPIDVSLTGNSGGNSAWVITDESLNILGLPPGPPFDLDGAGPGVCLIWHLSFEDGLTGAEVGMNAADLDGCYELSNSIAVTRNEPNGGSLSTDDETTICVDGTPDPIEVMVEDAVGTNAQWIITNDTFMILGKPTGPTFDLDGAGPGTCLIWYMRYEGSLMGDTLGGVLENISGCYDLSDSIAVIRNEPIGGTISTTDETTIC